MLCGTGSLLTALFAAAALTNEEPAKVLEPLPDGITNLNLAPLSSAPIAHPGGVASSQPLKPGVYQTYPDAIILIVPKRGIDDGIFAGAKGAGSEMSRSEMPVIHPPLQAVPISPSR
jgi:hypothetical protein